MNFSGKNAVAKLIVLRKTKRFKQIVLAACYCLWHTRSVSKIDIRSLIGQKSVKIGCGQRTKMKNSILILLLYCSAFRRSLEKQNDKMYRNKICR